MTPGTYYTARYGIIYSPTTAYTVRDAERHAHAFLDMALTERCEAWSAEWSCKQLADLLAAIREAKRQKAKAPVELARAIEAARSDTKEAAA